MGLEFWGVAHPPPKRGGRDNIADLSAAEISTTNMGRGCGTDVLMEHDHGAKIGCVNTSWEAADGSLHVAGVITNPSAEAKVRNGTLRGLSLGTSVIQDMSGKPLYRTQDEISICNEPRRSGCYINRIDGKKVRSVATFSASSSNRTRKNALPLSPTLTTSSTSPTLTTSLPFPRLRALLN